MVVCTKSVADRLDYLDIAKGIGILLVLFGHNLGGFPQFTIWIYSFHMPLFFIISGWLYAYKKPSMNIRVWIKRKACSLLYPYWIFSILVIAWKVFLFLLFDSVPDTRFAKIIWQTITTYGYHAMWFLPALFVAEVMLHLIEMKSAENKSKAIAIYGTIILLAFLILEYRSRFLLSTPVEFGLRYIARVCVAVMFCKIGMLLYAWNNRISTKTKIGVMLICFAISVYFAKYNGTFNLAVGNVGVFPLYVLLGLSGSVVVILFCQLIKKNAFLSFFGKNSLIVMCFHMDVSIEIAYILIGQLNLGLFFANATIPAVAIELILYGIMIPIVNKYFRFLVSPEWLKGKGRYL